MHRRLEFELDSFEGNMKRMTDVAGIGAGDLATATYLLESILHILFIASWGRSLGYRDPFAYDIWH